jgi:hypothetical protein
MVDDMSLNRLYHLPIISKKKRLVMKEVIIIYLMPLCLGIVYGAYIILSIDKITKDDKR